MPNDDGKGTRFAAIFTSSIKFYGGDVETKQNTLDSMTANSQ